MALAHLSVATIDSPQFINLQPLDINPLMSSCQIKVMYLGQNDNGTAIYKETATEMAKTLRGAPIVGYYRQEKEDFTDHGRKITIDDEGIHFDCMTKPYGFVSPDAEVWFQKFKETNRNGEQVVNEYLMTTGYLWTGQFPQAQDAIDNDRPQSMEIDQNSVKGEWTKEASSDLQFFIINSGIFSKLCILGNDTEPCFEGAGIGKNLTTFSKDVDDNFRQTLYSMMQDLQFALKGGSQVAKENITPNSAGEPTVQVDEEKEVSTSFTAEETKETQVEFVQKKEEDEEDSKEEQNDSKEENNSEDESDEKEDDEKKKKYSLELETKYAELENKFNELQASYSSLETELNSLREFKANAERTEKQNLINEFSMLSDEDKKDVVDNIDNYSLSEIKSKLAVICFDKKVNFNLTESSENKESMKEEKEVVTTFNLDVKDTTPDWVKAVKENM